MINNNALSFKLGPETKLKGKKTIDGLFTSGKSIRKGALRVVYSFQIEGTQHHIGYSTSKRFFKKAVDRNRVKRLLREAYRLNQHDLNLKNGPFLNMMFMFQSPKMPDYEHVNKLVKSILKDLNNLNILPELDAIESTSLNDTV